MYYLEHIQLGNIRRFAADVNIPVSRGATIFLAPNGTGKTSLFEGIECCLTGSVGRLVNNTHDALIRDTVSTAFTELRFSGSLTCRTTLQTGSRPRIFGDHEQLFPNVEIGNLPYLLRLTHLLPQRGGEWLVQAGSEDAGSLLNKLPIGRDAMRAFGNIQKIKRGFTGMITETEQQLEAISIKMRDWTQLLARKANVTQSLQSELLPLENIILQLNTVSNRFTQLSQVEGAGLSVLTARMAQLLQLVENELRGARQKLEEIASLESAATNYLLLENRLKFNEAAVSTQQAAVIEANRKYLESQQTVNSISTMLGAEKVTMVLMGQLAQIALDLDNAQNDLFRNSNTLAATQQAIEQLQRKLLEEQQKQQAEAIVRESHQRNTLTREALLSDQQQIAADRTALNRWRTHLEKLVAEQKSRDNLNTEISRLTGRKTVLDDEIQSRQQVYDNAHLQRDALMTATDAIKTAVANVISLLPSNTSACPVCLATYEPAVLRENMEAALRKIQPGLNEANAILTTAKNALDDANSHYQENQLAIARTEVMLSDIENTIQLVLADIATLRVQFGGATAPEEAEQGLVRKEEGNQTALQQNIQERTMLPELMSTTEWSLLLKSLDDTAGQIAEAERNKLELTSAGSQLTRRIEELQKLQATISTAETGGSIEKKEQHVRDLELSLEETTNQTDTHRRDLTQIEELAGRLDRQRDEIKQQIELLKARWTGAGLEAHPVAAVWDKAKHDVTATIAGMEVEFASIQLLQTELTKWGVVEELSQIDKDIDAVRGALTVAEFSERLSANMGEVQTKLNTIKDKNRAFSDFGEKLKVQLEQLQEYLLVINKPWRELLHRVVLDPRFTDTTLNAYTKNNKPHAEVKVPLHGSHVPANFVASEAQLTDLQFTFLLAMALNNQWAPWKGLLLDDPTQHHDLVHASSVFDVLRDYIVDHSYQVLLATHDSVHAKFFLRKLQNDGIPVNLIQLRAKQEGVIAELMVD